MPDFVGWRVGVVEVAGVGDDDVIGGGAGGEDGVGAVGCVVSADLFGAGGSGVERFAVGAEGDAVGAAGVVGDEALLPPGVIL